MVHAYAIALILEPLVNTKVALLIVLTMVHVTLKRASALVNKIGLAQDAKPFLQCALHPVPSNVLAMACVTT